VLGVSWLAGWQAYSNNQSRVLPQHPGGGCYAKRTLHRFFAGCARPSAAYVGTFFGCSTPRAASATCSTCMQSLYSAPCMCSE
jgi:hypothetical protein